MTERLRIIVTGLIAQHPLLGGVTWDYLQYVIGLARLGHDVYYFEDSGQWPYSLDGGPSGRDWVARDCTANLKYLAQIMARFGLAGRWAYHFPIASCWYGLSDSERKAALENADLLLNVSGTLEHPDEYRQVRRLAYIDSDPVFTQVKLARGEDDFRRRVDAHDVHFSFGERFSEAVPVTGHRWRPTRTPIVLSEWRPSSPRREAFTTVMSWTSYKPLSYLGQTYGQKDVEFRRFLDLPARVRPTVLEIALGATEHIDWQTEDPSILPRIGGVRSDRKPLTSRDLLTRSGWRVVDAIETCGDLDSYRDYIESSRAEWSVAKNGYVLGQPGWFSCRSACYLAAGRPVVVQDTGFGAVLPVGEGILTFKELAEVADAIREIETHYERHAAAARNIAEEFFDSDKVLGRLLEASMTAMC